MDKEKYQINLRPRHLRSMFFIEHTFDYDKLVEIMIKNLSLWGGRYNPIIPVENNAIRPEYLSIAKYYDPDIVYYSNNVSLDIVESQNFLNPREYLNIDEPSTQIKGLYSFLLFNLLDKDIIVPDCHELWQTKSDLLSYYSLNFHLNETSLEEFNIIKYLQLIKIDSKNFSEVDKLIHQKKIFNKNILSMININTKVLRSKTHSINDFQIIISKDKTQIKDLIYFWNRQLFIPNRYPQIHQFIITLNELDKLLKSQFFKGILLDYSINSCIILVSFSLSTDELTDIRDTLSKYCKHLSFKVVQISFPFEILDSNGLYERELGEKIYSSFVAKKGILEIPPLSFAKNINLSMQNCCLDISIQNIESQTRYKKFIRTEDPQYYFSCTGRINSLNDTTLYVCGFSESEHIKYNLPDFQVRVHQSLFNPLLNGKHKPSGYANIKINDDGYKLKSFFALFRYSYHSIEELLFDKFWFDLIEDLSTNDRIEGNTITFKEIYDKCMVILTEQSIQLGDKKDTYLNAENLKKGLIFTLEDYCEYNIFFKGFTSKCPYCSSKYWFSINEIRDKITCKGCLQSYSFPIEHPFSYKLNDLIKNNFFQKVSDNKYKSAGNYTVIRTLIYLNNQSNYSFSFLPQANIYKDLRTSDPFTDIDILCEVDGRLIIGEAKHDSAQFLKEKNKKSLNNLIEISSKIYPHKILLACSVDTNNKLERSKKYIEHHIRSWNSKPLVETYKSELPSYFGLTSSKYFYD